MRHRARLIAVSETEKGEALAEAKIKQMTGGDVLKARPLYGKYIQFEIIGKILLATNSLPSINNTDHGIWRQIHAILFSRTLTAEEQNVESLNQYSPIEGLGLSKFQRLMSRHNDPTKFKYLRHPRFISLGRE